MTAEKPLEGPEAFADFLEYVDPSMAGAKPLQESDYKVPDPWQIVWHVRDPEESGIFFVKLDEGLGANPIFPEHATQLGFAHAVGVGVMKAREVNEGQNFDRDHIYIINAARTLMARVRLPEDEVTPYYTLTDPSLGPIFTD